MCPDFNLRTYLAIGAAFAYVTITVFWLSVSAGLSHDEHQFMASAFLVSEYNLHPYQDFAYFHMPNLVYVYAPFFWLTDYPLLAIRLFSGLCAIAITLVLFFVSRSLFRDENRGSIPVMISLGSVILFTNSNLFITAASHVWNHTSSTLCAVLAFILYCRAVRRSTSSTSWKCFLLSGLFLGFAIGIRLSFAPLVVPFVASTFLSPAKDWRWRLSGIFVFGTGILIANIPTVYFLITSKEQFLFGNFGYPQLNTLYRQEMRQSEAMTLASKARYLFENVFSRPGSLLIIVVVAYSFMGVGIKRIREAVTSQFELQLLLLLLPFLYLGSFAPTPSWYQYFFAPEAFTVLLVLYSLAYLQNTDGRYAGARLLVLAAVLSSLYGAFPKTPASIRSLFRPKSWYTLYFHNLSTEVANHVATSGREGKVLTLAPLLAVESKLPVYSEFATGPFAWRITHLLSPKDRQAQSLVGPSEIESLLERDRPRAILTSTYHDKELGDPFIQVAQKLGYHQKRLSNGSAVWISPP